MADENGEVKSYFNFNIAIGTKVSSMLRGEDQSMDSELPNSGWYKIEISDDPGPE